MENNNSAAQDILSTLLKNGNITVSDVVSVLYENKEKKQMEDDFKLPQIVFRKDRN